MAKKESTFGNMVVALLVITLGASTALGFVYELTKGPIAEAKAAKKNNAIIEVIPEFTNNPGEEAYKKAAAGDTLHFYPGKKDGELVGTAVETFSTQGFSGMIRIMVGFLPDGTIHNIAVLDHEETPGLGDKMEKSKSDFSLQFQGKNPEDFQIMVTKDGGDIEAITASTISSRAFCEAVKRAYDALKEGGLQ